MRILFITTHLNKGGISSYIYSLAAAFKKKGHTIVVASSGGEIKDLFLENDIEYIHIPIRTKNEISFSVLFSYFILKRYLSKNKIDIIHAHARVTQVLASFLSKKFKVPVITTCHGFFKPRWHRKVFPCWGNKVIAISSQVMRHLINDFNVPKRDIALIHHGIDLGKIKKYSNDEINLFKRNIGIPENFIVVGTIARFSVVKGLEYLVKAAQLALKENDKIMFLFIGSGKEEPKLRQLTKDLGIQERVIFHSPVDNLSDYLCTMDIFVMPSVQEGLGLAILEAQARKVPVVASDVGGIPDIIEDSITGVLAQPRDESAISRSILKLIKDKSLYSMIKENAYNKITKEFSLERMITETEDVYREIINRKDLLC